MPTYSFKNNETGEEWTDFMSISELETFLKDSPHIIQTITKAPAIGDPGRMGRLKPSTQMREQLKRIHKGSGRHSKIDTGNLTSV